MTPATKTRSIQWIEEHLGGGVELLHVSAELSLSTGLQLADRLDALAADGRRDLILDLRAVRVLEPAAVLPLVRASRHLRARDVRVSLVLDPLLLIFEIPGIEEFHDVAMTVAGALERLDSDEPVAPAHEPAPLPHGAR